MSNRDRDPPACGRAARRGLSAPRERELSARWRAGDRDAGQRIVEACLPLVISIALPYRRAVGALDDLVQEGAIGLLKAASRFDPDRGCRLTTYAAPWIRAEIREHVMRSWRIVRLGASKSERRAFRLYQRTRERDPEVLSAGSGLSVARAAALVATLTERDLSIDFVPSEGLALAERLAADAPTPEELAANADDRRVLEDDVRRAIESLPAREQLIVRSRWLTEEPRTLEELGAALRISRERVRQLEERAKRQMRARLEALEASRTARAS